MNNTNANKKTKKSKNIKPKFNYIDKYMYQSKDVLGEGAFGVVYKGYYTPTEGQQNEEKKLVPLAIKKQTLPSKLDEIEKLENLNSIRHDIVTLKLLDHPNIVRLMDVKKKDQDVYMIMEYCNEKDLTSYMKGKDYSEIEIRYIFAQILQAFKHIHAQNLMHRDIKPQNIMVNDDVIKMGDFGFAKKFEESKKIIYTVYNHKQLDVIKGPNYYISTVNVDLPSDEVTKDQKFILIQSSQAEDTYDYKMQITSQHPDSKVYLGVCDLQSIQDQNKASELKGEPINCFNNQKEYKGFYAVDSQGKTWYSGAMGELIDNNDGLVLDDTYTVLCRVNTKNQDVIFTISSEDKNENKTKHFSNVFNYPEFDKSNLCVFAIITSKDDVINITMPNGPKLYESFKGTLLTVAPQVIEGYYSHKCDIYSLGCTLYWMIYKEFLYQDIKNQFKLNKEQKKNIISFPEKPKISEELKHAIRMMLQYNEEDRIDCDDLFKLPVFNMKSLIEDPNLNILNTVDYENNQTKILDYDTIRKQVDEEFEIFIPKEYDEDYNEKQEQKALDRVNEVDRRIQSQKINKKIRARLKFEKGKAQVVRMVAKSIKDFQTSGRVVFGDQRVLIQDLLDLIKFGLTKFELIMMKHIISSIQDKQNGYINLGAKEEEWIIFQDENQNTELANILKALIKETNLFEKHIYAKQRHEANQFLDNINIQLDINQQSINNINNQINIKEYLENKFEMKDQKEFFSLLFNLIIQLIKYLKKPIQNFVNKDNAFQRLKDVVEVIDNLLILLSLEKIFVYDTEAGINFSTFFENKKISNNSEKQFELTFKRVQNAIEVFFQGAY